MRIHHRIAATSVGLALALTPAVALAHGNPGQHGHSGRAPGQLKKSSSSSSSSSTTTTPRAYGKMCQGESKMHVKGTPGTPFSQCVKAMAQMAKSPKTNPHKACAGMSKQHVKGQKGTPFSQCIVAANRLRQSERTGGSSSTSGGSTSGSSTSGSSTSGSSTSGGSTTAAAAVA
jgi:hypothetical protein